jgi:hypothetical protein
MTTEQEREKHELACKIFDQVLSDPTFELTCLDGSVNGVGFIKAALNSVAPASQHPGEWNAAIGDAAEAADEWTMAHVVEDTASISCGDEIRKLKRTEQAQPSLQQPDLPDFANAARFRWLCEDHADAHTRQVRDVILSRISGISLSAASQAIDYAMVGEYHIPDAGKTFGVSQPVAPDQNAKRLAFLHSVNVDSDGFEYGVAKVKFSPDGSLEQCYWTCSDHSDIDAIIESVKGK